MSTLAFDGGAPRHLLARLLDRSDLAQVVPKLDPKVLHQLVRRFGLEQCGEIVALATPQQLTQIFDDDLWRSDLPGSEDQFDADRFGVWLEVLAEAGDAVAAQKLVAMDFDFVTAALSRQVFVLDQESMIEVREAAEYDFDLEAAALRQHHLEERERSELGGYTVIAKRGGSWDAILALLTSLDHDHPKFFRKLMQRCAQISTEYVVDNGGLYEVLTSDEQIMADASGAREERRQRQGHVSPLQAQAFLKLARARPTADTPADLDPLTAAYFRDLPRVAPASDDLHPEVDGYQADGEVARNEPIGRHEPRPLLLPGAASTGGDRLSRIRAQLLFARDHDVAAHARRSEELAYLANVLVAGCSFQSRRFRADEAADAALAVCNLGLENWAHAAVPAILSPDFLVRQNLVTVFRTGWRILYEDVCLFVANHLMEALADLRCDDRDIQRQIRDLFRRMKKQVAAGTPWLERENLDVIAILDLPSWTMLTNLLDEIPVVPRNACTPSEKPALRVTMDFDFISENRQIAWARDFAESLSEKLL
jgi:hypothetical protein